MIRAARHPCTSILGHPTGRLLLGREPYAIDMDRVLDACAECGCAIEINANPHRLDLDWRLVRKAISLGIPIVIGPDAHSERQLEYTRFGVDIARKGWARPADVLNCRSWGIFSSSPKPKNPAAPCKRARVTPIPFSCRVFFASVHFRSPFRGSSF
ncbi:MAG: hypothetical protein M5R36_21805 [Deltaproteobacteria bacterium]|nr:hypothetical protein [Deltaproteobacteria bacterium]